MYNWAMNHILKTTCLVFALTFLLAACRPQVGQLSPSSSPAVNQVQVSPIPPSAQEVVLEAGEDGQTALALTKEKTQVAFKQYDFGVMVEEINGLKADTGHYWALYLNDKYAEASADKTILKKGDRVKWVFEEIKK